MIPVKTDVTLKTPVRREKPMGIAEPLEVVMEFIKRINSGDVNALSELMTEDHIFQDALGKRFLGRETMRQGWTAYFKTVTGYQVHAEEFFQTDERFAIFGTASGNYVCNGDKRIGKFWDVPAAWRAVVKNGLIAEWRVYADNEPLRKLMSERANPLQ
jgi:ketosteroid isomerase-like protein